MAAKKRRRKRKKKIEASKKLAYWAAIVASLSAATSYLLSAFGRDPVSDVCETLERATLIICRCMLRLKTDLLFLAQSS